MVLEGGFGGPQHRIAQVAVGLRDHDIETVVVMPKRGSDRFAAHLGRTGTEYRQIGLHNMGRRLGAAAMWAVTFLPELVRLTMLLRRLRPDVVHCNGAWQPKGVLAARLARSRVVLHLNDTLSSRPMRAAFRAIAPLCHGFVVAGERVRETYLVTPALRAKPTAVIQAPVDTRRFDPEAVEPSGAAKADGEIRVATVANISPQKGYEHLVEVARIVSAERDDVRFRAVGMVPERQREYAAQVKDAAPAACVFDDPTDNVPGVLAAADIYLCSSVMEASPLSVWEAMAMALPVVSADVGDVGRFVVDGEAGFVVPVADVRALADRVLQLAAEPELRLEMGSRARSIAEDQLDVERCVAAHQAFYEEVARG